MHLFHLSFFPWRPWCLGVHFLPKDPALAVKESLRHCLFFLNIERRMFGNIVEDRGRWRMIHEEFKSVAAQSRNPSCRDACRFGRWFGRGAKHRLSADAPRHPPTRALRDFRKRLYRHGSSEHRKLFDYRHENVRVNSHEGKRFRPRGPRAGLLAFIFRNRRRSRKL